MSRILEIARAGVKRSGSAQDARQRQLESILFQCARTLWQVNRRLAVDCATSARVQIRSYLDSEVPEMETHYILPANKRRLADINRWLAEHKL